MFGSRSGGVRAVVFVLTCPSVVAPGGLLADARDSQAEPDERALKAYNAALGLAEKNAEAARELLIEVAHFDSVLALHTPAGRAAAAALPTLRAARNTATLQAALKKLRPLPGAKGGTAAQKDATTGLFAAEVKVLRSYLAAFVLARHSHAIRSRTYPGRQEDTLLLLQDLLAPDGPRESRALAALRTQFVGDTAAHKHGGGILFVDIGPAISNQWTPAVTALALCSAFPRMDVVGLDLPDEVDLFMERVSPRVRQEVLGHHRFHVLSGDGTRSLRAQLADSGRLVLHDRAPPGLRPGQPIVVRTSNAIDIYFKWDVIGPTLRNMAADFEDHPLLILFNRSILFKPRGSKQLRIVGRLSPRGFHHNELRLDSGGMEPYVLAGFFAAAAP